LIDLIIIAMIMFPALQMMHNIKITGFGTAEVVNYRKSGEAFVNSMSIEPVVSNGRMYSQGECEISHLLGRLVAKCNVPANGGSHVPPMSKLEAEGYSWMISNTLYKDSDDGGSLTSDENSGDETSRRRSEDVSSTVGSSDEELAGKQGDRMDVDGERYDRYQHQQHHSRSHRQQDDERPMTPTAGHADGQQRQQQWYTDDPSR